MSRAAWLLGAALWLGACGELSCGAEAPREPASSLAETPPSHVARWTETDVEGLTEAGPATVVSLAVDRIEVDNGSLVAIWPGPARAAAAEADPGDVPGWPLLSRALESPEVRGRSIPALTEVLRLARRIEASATGSETGAGTYQLRVARDVPYGRLEPVLYSASLAGYGSPQLRLSTERGDVTVPWPRAPRADPEAIEAALEAFEAGRDIPEVATGASGAPRLRLTERGVDVLVEGALRAPGCAEAAPGDRAHTYPADVEPGALVGCVEALDPEAVTLEVGAERPFGDLAPILVRLTRRELPLRILAR